MFLTIDNMAIDSLLIALSFFFFLMHEAAFW